MQVKNIGIYILLAGLLTACAAPAVTSTAAPQVALSTQTSLPATATPEIAVVPDVATLPEPGTVEWQPLLSNLNRPVAFKHAGDGSTRSFIVEQAGLIKVFLDGNILTKPFLDIRTRISTAGNEQGLLGLAFHPDFAENGFFYVNYTDRAGDTVIARFTADLSVAPELQSADPQSEVILLQVDQPARNHNGGGLAFGPDGYLYIGLGDGGGAGDPQGNGQALVTLLGKLLRLDVDTSAPYAIPADNPFRVGEGLPEIWAYGLRNPWGFAFDAKTGDLYLADVGQDAREEINYLPAAFTDAPANFGWNLFEGSLPYKPAAGSTTGALTSPVFEYGHDQGCSVTGGVLYRGQALPAFQGVYVFGDFCSGLVWGLLRNSTGAWTAQVLFKTGLQISAFGVDESGEIYMLDLAGGLHRLQPV